LSNGIYLNDLTKCIITGVVTVCDIKGCHNAADKYLISGEDDLFTEAWRRIKNREFIESYCFSKMVIGLCRRHYEEILGEEASEE